MHVAAGKRRLAKLPRAKAESLAVELVEQLRPSVQRALAEPDPDALSLRQLARVERVAAKIRGEMERLPARKSSRHKPS